MRREPLRPDLRIYHALLEGEDRVVERVTRRIEGEAAESPGFSAMTPTGRTWLVRLVYRLLLSSVQSSNRMLLLNYLEVTGPARFAGGFTANEVERFLDDLNRAVLAWVQGRDDVRGHEQELYDRITLPIEFGKDEVREQYERFQRGAPRAPVAGHPDDVPVSRSGREHLEETIWKCLVGRR
jgi:hypothetical protein